METKICTKCGKEKPIRSFGKRGKKRSAQCKECFNAYYRSLRHSTKYGSKTPEEQIKIEMPVLAKEGKYKEVVRRTQTILLPGEVNKFITVVCSCGLHSDLEYHHSFDEKNDYYEGECAVCSRIFKLNVVNK